MENLFSIQQLAAITEMSSHTLRYYEKIGLIQHVQRDQNGYRQYSEFDLAWVQFLLRLRATGMSMIKMKEFSDLRYQGDTTISLRRELLEKHYQDTLMNMRELQINLKKMEEKIAHYRALENSHLELL
ncbi:MerR family transcriptional regulator [Priestia koreensis]|uniref:MerR family transcriptional regulator n=1 Tax=Priestia koreensis TaxID=284581 RepID=A0A0M0L8X5_9BACI|nr:MerR family transcriptional regulator [Priestia koreensis]KOO47536.1 MerR family transcriptional regulator [Priestia koreensis]